MTRYPENSDTIDINDDTILNNCVVCSKRFKSKTVKAKYCSEACKQQAKRIRKLEDQTRRSAKTDVDKEFDTHKPGFYNFSDTIRTCKCMVCSKEFTTSLNLLKCCSVRCRDEMLANLTGRRV